LSLAHALNIKEAIHLHIKSQERRMPLQRVPVISSSIMYCRIRIEKGFEITIFMKPPKKPSLVSKVQE
jgi:hypothetical protein